MKLINTTNSHAVLIQSQLESTDATLVETYSAGNTDVVFTQAPKHYEIQEIEKIRDFFLKRKIDTKAIDTAGIQTIYADKLIEISIPLK